MLDNVAAEAPADPLKFKVAPHIVQDLGLNLYTSLPRVLVEFVANAYDADSPSSTITVDFEEIDRARIEAKRIWHQNPSEAPLEETTLPDHIQITIEDAGHGMSRSDLSSKFLIAGRRRREEEARVRTGRGRVIMGRKGLGKLAGFGVAHRVEVITRAKGESHATKITLDYDQLIKKRAIDEAEVGEEKLDDGGGFAESGTRIVLSRLVYEPMKSRPGTLENAIGDHFALVDSDDFLVTLNGQKVVPTPRQLVFAYPNPELSVDQLVTHQFESSDGRRGEFSYRIRFIKQSLPARERGVRVYAHKRLAAAPDLLDIPTGMHGFRLTDYMDGVVQADFVDEQPSEYISTDRQSLRWEAPLLVPMRLFLSETMKDACAAYQKRRDDDAGAEVGGDNFTVQEIEKADLPAHKKRFAYSFAARLATICQHGVVGDEYKARLKIFVDGLGQGTLLKVMADLAKEERPDFDRLVAHVTQLADTEFSELVRFAQGRLNGIEALRKICRSVDFKNAKKEDELHALFEKAPWLIHPSFAHFLTSNQSMSTLFDRLAKHLKIGPYAPRSGKATDDTRPDLVFVIGNEGARRVIIVELKAADIPLDGTHLRQLQHYMDEARDWLHAHGHPDAYVEGYLIGTRADPKSVAKEVVWLRKREEETKPVNRHWKVYDVLEVLEESEAGHKDLLETHDKMKKSQLK